MRRFQWGRGESIVRYSPQFAVACGFLLAISTGCGGSESGSDAPPTYDRSAARIPACAGTGKAIALPSGFPRNFPMPRGTSLLSSKRSFGATVVHGAIPTSSFVRTINFFHVNVPKASFKITYSESEPPRDAEGEYESKRYKGRWTLESIAGCKGAVRFEATAAPSS